jgi:hypothetical protein
VRQHRATASERRVPARSPARTCHVTYVWYACVCVVFVFVCVLYVCCVCVVCVNI